MPNQVLESKRIFDGKILSLRVDKVKLPDGKETHREIVEHKNGAAVLPVDHGMMIFVQQYRDAIADNILEIPAGLVETGEDPRETAERELQEEIGLRPMKLESCGFVYPTPGCCDEKTYVFISDRFETHRLQADDDEFIHVVKLPIQTVKKMYDHCEFIDAKTVCALGYYFSHHA
ncbi:NUDIX hydrolase [Pseudoramibacter sp.]|uniref:NUDIX hydrolase n=1 Tax=Pseudoramibacter sp. TaxID=2034862 RepID=UPI0025D30629|nr:NUDIX hydrolase [Pseudoramibacter sp.]MCH4072635.1 NUDIX hydrolase [Pseudoramibacter sp.]MCH4106406.1 NUDIX hydrolase [Pseudoramibacter sp.]